MWHIVAMSIEGEAPQSTPNRAMRYSFPPYYLGTVDQDMPIACLPGKNYAIVGDSVAPTGAEIRLMLIDMRQKLRWSRSMLAAYMGVSHDVVRRWETGQRNPNGAARRLIWLLTQLAFRPKALKTAVDVMFWGRGEELRQWNSGKKLSRATNLQASPEAS